MPILIGGAVQRGEQPYVIALAPGQWYYPPPGNYQAALGAHTQLEFWDWQRQQWFIVGSAGAAKMFLTDGYNWRIRNNSQSVASTTITGAGTSGTNGIGTAATGVTISAGAAPANGQAATFFPVVGGAVGAPTITSAGSGLAAPPILIVQPPPVGGRQATMDCTISGGAISGVTLVDAGAGYTAVPQVLVLPQLGSYAGAKPPSPGDSLPTLGNVDVSNLVINWNPVFGASFQNLGAFTTLPVITAGALINSGTLTGIGIIQPGIGYSVAPTLSITGGSTMTATAALYTGTAYDDTTWLYPGAVAT